MSKLVKIKDENRYVFLTQAEYDADPSLYIDRSSNPLYWLNHYTEAGISYLKARYYVKEIYISKANGYDDFRDTEKEALSIFGIGNQTQIAVYLMGKYNLDLMTAKGLMVQRLAANISKLSSDTSVVIHSPKIIEIGVKYLSSTDPNTGDTDATQVNNLTFAIQGFLTEYERYGILGLNYNDEREGIMDYFESTNSYSSGGLKNYVFNPDLVTMFGSEDAVRLSMITELKEVFVKGNI
jgi:hypothetical protein